MDLERLLIASAITTESGHKVVSLEKALDYIKRAKVDGIKLALNFTYLNTKDDKVLAAVDHISTTLESILNVPVIEPTRMARSESIIPDVPTVAPVAMNHYTPLQPRRKANGDRFKLSRLAIAFNKVDIDVPVTKYDLMRLSGIDKTDKEFRLKENLPIVNVVGNCIMQLIYQGYAKRCNTVAQKGLIARVTDIPEDVKYVSLVKKDNNG